MTSFISRLQTNTAHGAAQSKVWFLQKLSDLKTLRFHHLIADPYPFVLGWIILGIVAIIIPRQKFDEQKEEFYTAYGYQIEYENAQRAYEEAQHQNNNNNNNNNYYYYLYQQNYPKCYWFQYNCRIKQFQYEQNYRNTYGSGDGDRDDEIQIPNWYRFIGGTVQEDERRRDEQNWDQQQQNADENSGPLHAVYVWMLLLFICTLLHGAYILLRHKKATGLRLTLFIYLQFAIIVILMVGQGVIKTDNRDLEESVYGFQGQEGILIAYTMLGFATFCLIALLALHIRALILYLLYRRKLQNSETDTVASTVAASDYKYFDGPSTANSAANPIVVVGEDTNYRRMDPNETGGLVHPPVLASKGSLA